MTEPENNTLPPPPPRPDPSPDEPAGEESSLREELRRARSRNKVLVAIAAVLGSVFVLLAGGAYIVYTRLSAARENVEAAFGSLQQELPVRTFQQPPPVVMPGQGSMPMASSTIPVSSLGLFSGGLPSSGSPLPSLPQAALDPAQAERVAKAMNKYANRPIVKEFIAELKRDPEMAAAFKASDGSNPLEMMAHIQKARSGDRLVMKYLARPEAFSLMMEVMADPDLQPLLRGLKLPGGAVMPPGGQGIQLPQGGPQGAPSTVDTSVMGGSPGAPAGGGRRVPPSVDSE
ncbi:MAG: hypothetical protein M0011_04665 [Elusimicrobia bacterium]|nr:hypothetical protein [Elusimicrobiota bacterium]